jgi:hypothetical protein
MGCAFAATLAGCHAGQKAAPAPSLPSLLIDDRGITMPLDEAVTKISYRPWIPPVQVLKFAVIPPLGDLDTPAHRGIAIEYASGRQPMLLSEWPKQNFTLLFLHNKDISVAPCETAHYKADGVAWTTHGKLAMTLQPDGTTDPKMVEAEARRLIAAGACR